MSLAEFLNARLDEDEATARDAHKAPYCSGCSDGWDAGFDPDRCDCGYPTRVLREVEAKRAIVQRHVNFDPCIFDQPSGGEECPVIRHLAAVYSDHPDYRQEWKPDASA